MGLVGDIALRFLRSRRSRGVSIIAAIAVGGTALGVMALDVTLAVMNGFRGQIQETFVDNMPMVSVITSRPRGLDDVDGLLVRLEQMPGVEAAAPFLRKEGVLTAERFGGRAQHAGAVVWGIDPDRQMQVTPLDRHIEPPFDGFGTGGLLGGGEDTPGVVLGRELASRLRVGLGDVVVLSAPRPVGGGKVETTDREFLVVGELASGMFEFDNAFAYIDLDVARSMYSLNAPADAIGLRVSDMLGAPRLARAIEDSLGSPPYFANDWISLNRQLFDWIRMEKVLMLLLLSLISLVASFAVVAILLLMVSERQKDIGILMALGVSRVRVWSIFNTMGMLLAGTGIAVGTLAGLGLCLALDRYGFRLPGEVYFVDTLPVQPHASDFLLVAGIAALLGTAATSLASLVATRYSPVEVIRHD